MEFKDFLRMNYYLGNKSVKDYIISGRNVPKNRKMVDPFTVELPKKE